METDYDTKLEIFTADAECNETTTGYYVDDAECEFSWLQSSLLGVSLAPGIYYIVVDGYGGFYEAIIENDNITNCTLQISHRKQNYGKQNHHIHVAIAPPKNHERIEWFVEKTIEIGIQEISFIVAKRSERNNVKLNRIISRAKEWTGCFAT